MIPQVRAQTNWTLVGWNNLGMHCMDSDYSVFSILPPYNTVNAQLINGQGRLVTNMTGIGVTYRAIADPDGSFNSTSVGKGNFWQYVNALFGVALAPDVGLPVPGPGAYAMPGTNNIPQAMGFESGFNWLVAYGIPISPYDDAGRPNQYPMMRLVATNSAGLVLAQTDVVLPVSDEMDCKLCHLSGSGPAAEPAAGWVWDPNPGRDYRLNILRLHDEAQLSNPTFRAALATVGDNTNGLFATVTINKKPILCASCHLSEALPGSGQPGLPPLTRAMHGLHATVVDPRNGLTLDASANRVSCYSCHPGSVTRCLRGAMGKAVAADGSMQMQCQSCHGSMSLVGGATRTGWLEEPNCQACHVGGATNSFGVIRFLDALTGGVLRVTADQKFATNPNTPAPNLSLYRFSRGHGGLQCSACHGSTHAEFPTSLPSDNRTSIQQQGHAGVRSECTSCHQTQPNTVSGGPHGMHPVGQSWIEGHKDASKANCKDCHGANSRGAVLSRSFADRTLSTAFGTKVFWKGYQIGCYTCHDGPNNGGNTTTKGFPVVTNKSAFTTSGIPVQVNLGNTRCRIVSQASHGAVALSGGLATYYPDQGFVGSDSFTFCATNDYNDSNLGTVSLSVLAPTIPPPISTEARFFSLNLGGTNAQFGLVTELGPAYILESSDDVVTGTWTTVGGIRWGRTDTLQIDNADPANAPRQFYRARQLATNPIPVIDVADSATNTTYDAGWTNGSAGGSGWTAGWELTTPGGGVNAGFFVATTNQANMSIGPRAWGLWANGGSTALASRAFAPALQVGQSFVLRFDNNAVTNGATVGFGIQNAVGDNLFECLFVGGGATYRINDSLTGRPTIIPWSANGWDVSFQLVSPTAYTLTCGPYLVTGTLRAFPDMSPVRVKVWNGSAGAGSSYDLFINDLRVIRP